MDNLHQMFQGILLDVIGSFCPEKKPSFVVLNVCVLWCSTPEIKLGFILLSRLPL